MNAHKSGGAANLSISQDEPRWRAGEGKSITIRHLDFRQTLGVHDLVLLTPGGSLNPFTVTATDPNQGKEAGDQDGSKEDGCEEEKRYRKHIHGDTPQWSGPLPAKATEVRTDQVYNFGLTDTRIDATRGRYDRDGQHGSKRALHRSGTDPPRIRLANSPGSGRGHYAGKSLTVPDGTGPA